MGMTATSPEHALASAQALRAHFDTGVTHPYAARLAALKALKASILKHEEELLTAMHADMRKPRFEAYMSDVGLVYAAIDHAATHLKEWMRPRAVHTPLAIQIARSEVLQQPLGVVLIIAPWNYPALLLLSPLVGALAAGNCVMLKPSEDAPATATVVERIVGEGLHEDHVTVVQGAGRELLPALMHSFRFDHVFFTGSAAVGREVLKLAAEQLVPVTLELGGKSPAIVDATADVEVAARRIAWSKYFNAGQTCIATDHALVHAAAMEPFLDAFAKSVVRFYGDDPRQSPDFARMIHERRFNTVRAYLAQGDVHLGGITEEADGYIAPTVLTGVALDSPVMREEIFGPVLPVLSWSERDELKDILARNPQPLAAYLFSHDRRMQRWFKEELAFGGGCINHCMLQFGPPDLPFGGVGHSGMGRYHGFDSFALFSNHKGVVQASTLLDHRLQDPPYTKLKERILRRVL